MSLPDIGLAADKLAYWRGNTTAFARDLFGMEPEPFQQDLFEHFSDPSCQRIGLKACKGPGKTAGLAVCAWAFLLTRPHPKIAATSISRANLSDGLWTEMAKWQQRSKLLSRAFTWTKSRIFAKGHERTWWMSARSWSKTADKEQQANTLAGLHEDYAMAVLDEMGGIPDGVMSAADAILASEGPEHRIIGAGNPTHLEGPLYAAATSARHLWHLIEVTGDPDDPKRCSRVSLQWAKEQIQQYGRDNPWVLVNVFGQFPPSSLNVLLGPDQVAAAMQRHYQPAHYSWSPKILGVDCGRFGGDRSVIFPRQGKAARMPVIIRPDRTTKNWTQTFAARIAQGADKWGADAIFIDDTGGWGAGVIDLLTAAGYPVTPVNFGGKAINPRYKNRRAEMHFGAADWVKEGGALPKLPELQREATATAYWFNKNVFEIEEKEQVKLKLNGESPDLWDAFCLTFAAPVAPRTGYRSLDNQNRHAVTQDDDQRRAVGIGVGRAVRDDDDDDE